MRCTVLKLGCINMCTKLIFRIMLW